MKLTKKALIRFLSSALLAIMILSIFSACSKKKEQDKGNIVPIDTGTNEDPMIPSKDYGGIDFTFITKRGTHYNTDYIYSEGENSEVLNDAVYRRNTLLKEKYNINIKQYDVTDLLGEARVQIQTGDPDFDAILANCTTLATLAREDFLYNLLDIERFDMTKSYWDQNASKELKMGNKLYFTNCALNIHTIGFIVIFNKQLVEDYSLTSPYEYMRNNEWTIDNWGKMVLSVSKDINNDGAMTEFDQYGTLSEHHNMRMFLYASGVRGTVNDETGKPRISLMDNANKTVAIYEKVKEVLKNEDHCYCMVCSNVGTNGYENKYNYLRYLFTQDLYMFHYSGSGNLPQLADMESEFGIVPFPKYEPAQETYKTMYQVNSNLFALPSSLGGEELERTANIIEDMNYYSSFIVVPAWFDTLLARRYTRDNESEESLRILRDNCVFDLGMYYDFGGLRTTLLDVDFRTGNISRNFARLEKSINSSIDKVYAEFSKT